MHRRKNFGDIIVSILRVIFYLVLILGSIFIVYTLLDAYMDQIRNPQELDGFKLTYAITLIIIGPTVYIPCLLIAIISLVISLINGGSYNYDSNKVKSIVMIFLPIIGYGILYVLNFFLK